MSPSQVVLSFDAAVSALAEALGDAEAWFWEPDMLCHPNGARVAVLPPSTDEQKYGTPDAGMQQCTFALAYHGLTLAIATFGCGPVAIEPKTFHVTLLESFIFNSGPILPFWKMLLHVNFSSEAIRQWQILKIQCIVAILEQDSSVYGRYYAYPTYGFVGGNIHLAKFPAPPPLIDAIEALRAEMPLIYANDADGAGLLWDYSRFLKFEIPESAHARAAIFLQAHQDTI